MINFEKTIISQYANSETIFALIEQFNDCIDPRADFEQFYHLVWNVDTAKGFGLDIWGRIVDVSRVIKLDFDDDTLGFFNTEEDFQPFDQAPMRSWEDGAVYFSMTDDAYRTLIMIKAFVNIIYVSAQNINRILSMLFAGRGRCYYLSLGNMHGRYVFEFNLLPHEQAIIEQSNLLPNPSGVLLEFLEIPVDQVFGFYESIDAQPFNQGYLWGR